MSQSSETYMTASLGTRDDPVDSAMQEYTRSVGERLRTVREQRLYTLLEVERQSNSEFKSAVVAAYERGERMLSIQRLDRLAQFYGVPIADLLPQNGERAEADSGCCTTIRVRLRRLDELQGEPFDRFRGLVGEIRRQRGDDGSDEVTLREEDLHIVASMFDVQAAEMADRLTLLDLLA